MMNTDVPTGMLIALPPAAEPTEICLPPVVPLNTDQKPPTPDGI